MASSGRACPDPRPIRGGTVLKLDYSTLKKHLSSSAEGRGKRKRAQPNFIELIGASGQNVDEYVIEFESARGRKLRIHCKTNTPPDWPVLLRAWRGE